MSDNYVDSTGLVLQTLSDIVTALETGFRDIYGADISLDANSPDGQMINLFAQAKMDILDCIASVYNSFSPGSAGCAGAVLDQRCALNGITRRGGVKSTCYIQVWADRVVALVGESAGSGTVFTVSDNSGNKFKLTTSTSTATGNNLLHFTAEEAGEVEIAPANITTIETVTLGITGVTGATGAVIAGRDEETDAELRQRRSVSVANPSSGFLDGLQGAILALDNVTSAKVYENNSSATDAYGIPPHSIWAVVDGGDETEIAEAIDIRRNAGCGTYGGTGTTGTTGTRHIVGVTQVNGLSVNIEYSEPNYQNLYVLMNLQATESSHEIDSEYLKDQLVENFVYDINEKSDFTDMTVLVKGLDPYVVVTSGGVGPTGGTGASNAILGPSGINNRWILSTSNITINEA